VEEEAMAASPQIILCRARDIMTAGDKIINCICRAVRDGGLGPRSRRLYQI
jgi:hypothetical protein